MGGISHYSDEYTALELRSGIPHYIDARNTAWTYNQIKTCENKDNKWVTEIHIMLDNIHTARLPLYRDHRHGLLKPIVLYKTIILSEAILETW